MLRAANEDHLRLGGRWMTKPGQKRNGIGFGRSGGGGGALTLTIFGESVTNRRHFAKTTLRTRGAVLALDESQKPRNNGT